MLDPEIGLNIVDLGLVFAANRSPEAIEVRLTLTSRACPLGDGVGRGAREDSGKLSGRRPVNVELVWDPLWTPDLITDRGYELLGRTRTRTHI